MTKKGPENQMWGGRFASGPDAIMEAINASIGYDRKLYAQDIAGSKAHAEMLAKQGIISTEDANQILTGLDTILSEIESGAFEFSTALEDIHMNVEARLADLIGPAAGRLHTARSRNDQVAVDFRLWTKQTLAGLDKSLDGLVKAFVDKAEMHADTVMPGFTHLQTAQPVTFGHHCLAYVEMFARDRSRAQDAMNRMDQCPLGTAALAGTGFDLDRHMTAAALGFAEPTRNHSTVCLTGISRLISSPWPPSAQPIFPGLPKRSSSGQHRNSGSCNCPTDFRRALPSCRKRKTPMPQSWSGPNPGVSTVL